MILPKAHISYVSSRQRLNSKIISYSDVFNSAVISTTPEPIPLTGKLSLFPSALISNLFISTDLSEVQFSTSTPMITVRYARFYYTTKYDVYSLSNQYTLIHAYCESSAGGKY